MNILQFICPTGLYGAERWILALANNFDKTQIRCDLVVTHESAKQNLEMLNLYPSTIGQIHTIQMNGRFDISVIHKLCNIIKEHNIDIIHTHGYKSDIIGLLSAKITGINSISTPHGFGETNDKKLKAYIKVGGYLLKHFDIVAPLSKQLIDDVKAFGVKSSKIKYIQNGVDFYEIDAVRNSFTRHDSNKIKTIGYIGQMIPRKNLIGLLDAFEDIFKTIPNVRLQLIGDGIERNRLEDYANTLYSREHIDFLGYQKDRLKHLASFDIFVMTSSSEGIPRCMMEAMAMGIPVAAYDIPGVNQLIIHENNGLLAPFGSKDKLVSNCKKLILDDTYAKNIALSGRDYAFRYFSANRMADEYLEAYNSLL